MNLTPGRARAKTPLLVWMGFGLLLLLGFGALWWPLVNPQKQDPVQDFAHRVLESVQKSSLQETPLDGAVLCTDPRLIQAGLPEQLPDAVSDCKIQRQAQGWKVRIKDQSGQAFELSL